MKSDTLFASSLQTTDQWLDEVSREMDWSDPRRSYQILRTVLHTLRDRLPVEEAVQLAAEMPIPVRGAYYEGWKPAGKPVKEHVDLFLARIEKSLLADNLTEVDANYAAHVVFRLLDRRISSGEIEHVKGVLPDDIRELWPRPAAA